MRYVLPDGRFWEVSLAGRVVNARWGKGGVFKTRRASFKTDAAAHRELDGLVQKVVALGYQREVERGIAAVLRARPDDDFPLLVYADELLTRGDLRGELAALVAAEKSAELRRFLAKHAAVLFEAAADDVHAGKVAGLVWAPGFVREATLATKGTADVGELLAVTKRFLASPVAEFVRGLNFGLSYAGWAAEAQAVTRARHPELINALRFDAFEAGVQLRELDAGDFGEVWAALPELREFKVNSNTSSAWPARGSSMSWRSPPCWCWRSGTTSTTSADGFTGRRGAAPGGPGATSSALRSPSSPRAAARPARADLAG